MAADTVKLFADNQMDVLTPILPADQSMAGTTISLSSVFERANPAPAAGTTTATPSIPDTSMIADMAMNAGNSLRSIEGAKSDIGYAGGAALKLGGEAIGALFGSVLDKDNDGIADVERKPVIIPAPAVGMPSPAGM